MGLGLAEVGAEVGAKVGANVGAVDEAVVEADTKWKWNTHYAPETFKMWS